MSFFLIGAATAAAAVEQSIINISIYELTGGAVTLRVKLVLLRIIRVGESFALQRRRQDHISNVKCVIDRQPGRQITEHGRKESLGKERIIDMRYVGGCKLN